jgi:hypothetical protein
MGNTVLAFGLIALIIFISIVVTAFPPVMGSTAEDALLTNASNSTTLQQGTGVVSGIQGVDMGLVYVVFIILIAVGFLIIYRP